MAFHSTTGPSAFRLKAHPGAVYEPSLERGRPVLHGPLAANQLITEVGVIFNHVYVFDAGYGEYRFAITLSDLFVSVVLELLSIITIRVYNYESVAESAYY
jgi:hypothetical protein